MTPALQDMDVTRIAAGVRSGKLRAVAVVEQVLSEIARLDPRLNCFTAVFADRARKAAMAVDARVARGEYPGLLAGVPFGVKNLFDVKGQVTVAGSKILRGAEPAKDDAVMIRRLEAAGAILIGALNMDEFAYGFSTENEHYGTTRNPHDESRIAGGSSGGSAAAVAARLLPLALGSDTNGSVRVPASLCGVFGLKPTFGRLDRTGMYPFVDSLDHVGIFTRTAADLRHSYDCMHGEAPTPDVDAASLRIAVLGGWFSQPAGDGVAEAVKTVGAAMGGLPVCELIHSDIARSAAFCITAAEGGSLHLPNLRSRVQDFDRATRERFLAGALLPSAAVEAARRFRQWYRQEALGLFETYDVLIAPATISAAPRIGEASLYVGGQSLDIRANLGLFTQPVSFIGLPAVSVPVVRDGLPLGVQLIGAPGREDRILAVAIALEQRGVVRSSPCGEAPSNQALLEGVAS